MLEQDHELTLFESTASDGSSYLLPSQQGLDLAALGTALGQWSQRARLGPLADNLVPLLISSAMKCHQWKA